MQPGLRFFDDAAPGLGRRRWGKKKGGLCGGAFGAAVAGFAMPSLINSLPSSLPLPSALPPLLPLPRCCRSSALSPVYATASCAAAAIVLAAEKPSDK
jgi:hypothetical protein